MARKLLVAILLVLPVAQAVRAGEEAPEPAAAEDEQNATTGVAAEEIVITARRCEQPAFEVDRSLYQLARDEMIEMQAHGMPDALLETTGVYMQRTNRGAGAPFLRGMVGPQNLILIDGIRFNNSTFRTGPNQVLALLDPAAFDRVEVMLGPGSVLYGSDAMGGVIQAFPRAPVDETGFHALTGTRFSSPDLSSAGWMDADWRGEPVSLSAGGTFVNHEELRAGEGVMQPISDFVQGSWRARGDWDMTGDMQLGVVYLGARICDAGREDRLYEGRFRFYDNDDDFLYLDWRYRPAGALRQLRVAASFHRTHESVDRYRCDLPDDPVTGDADPCLDAAPVAGDALPSKPLTRQEMYLDTVLTPGLLAHADLAFWEDRVQVTTGLEGYYDHVSSSSKERRGDRDPAWAWQAGERGNFSDGSTYLSLGGFAHAEVDLLGRDRHALILGAGGRISHFAAEADQVPGLGDVSYRHTGLIGSASLRYVFRPAWMAYASFSQGFRAPNLQESTVLGDTGSKFEVPNDDLAPEKSDTIEIGTRADFKPVRVFVSAFVSFTDDVIDERELTEAAWRQLGLDPAAVGDKPVVQRVNSAEALYWGMEGTFELGPFFDTRLWTNLAWVRAEVERPDGQVVPARRVPPLMGAAGLRYEPRPRTGRHGWYLELFTRFAGSQDRLHPSDESDLRICEDPDNPGDTFGDSGRSCPGTKAWATLNLRGGYRLDQNLRVDLAATNLTDELYRYHGSGVDAPGIGVSASLVGSF